MRAAALRTSEAYWRVSRGEETRPEVRVVAAGLEPGTFTDLFDTWRERDDAAEANIAVGLGFVTCDSVVCEIISLL